MAAEQDKLRATALIAVCSLFFSSIAIFTVIATSHGMSLSALMTGRYFIAVLVLLVFVRPRTTLKVGTRNAVILMVFFGGAQGLVAWLSLASLEYITAATMAFLFYTFPAIVAIIAAATRLERLTPLRILALCLSLTGIVIMVGAPWSMRTSAHGVTLAFLSGVVYAIYVIMVSKVQRDVSPAAATTYIAAGAGTHFLIAGSITDSLVFSPHPAAIGAMASLAVFSTTLAFLGFLRGLRVLGTVRTSIVSTLEPFWTALLGALVLSQPLTPRVVAGGLLIATAVIMLQLRERNSP